MPPQSAELTHARAPSPRWLGIAADFVANQAAWWWCVLAARAGSPTGLLGPAAYVVGQLVFRPNRRRAILGLAAAGALTGLAGDFALVRAHLLAFPPTFAEVAPFMLGLWAMFAVSLTASAAFLAQAPVWGAALFGAVAGPLAYSAGERLSVLTVREAGAAAVALEWMIAAPWLAYCARRAEREAST